MSAPELGSLPGAALVSGGSGSVGAAVCRLLAERGADVGLSYRSRPESAAATVAAVAERGREAEAWAADLADPGAARRLVEAAVERFGGVHTLVHAAGPLVTQGYISELTPERYREALEAEAAGFFNLVSPLLPELRRARGSIVAVTTVALRRFPSRDGLSPATKGAVEGLVRALAAEEGRFGVRANCVGPGILGDGMTAHLRASGDFPPAAEATTTRAIPLRRLGTTEEVAEAVAFLASPRAGYISGQTLDVDGGYSV